VLAGIITDPPYIATALSINTPTVSSPTVAVGATETVNVNVTNNGNVTGSFSINLLIGGNIADSKAVTLGPRTSQTVSFAVIESSPGQYVASIDTEHNVTFTVQ
jgi:archaellum component FlaF (FlaF/FlaG flagellin family)